MRQVSVSVLLLPCLMFAATSLVRAQNAPVNTEALVERASHNELAATNSGHPFRYLLHKIDDGKQTTKEIFETKDGDVARLVEVNGEPLNPDAEKAEIDRLNNLMANPQLQKHRQQKEKADSDRANEMVRLLPTAFLYKFEGMVEGPNGLCYRLSFSPNPNFNPPDREAEVYHGMAGELWIDKGQERMVKFDAHLISDVDFGWGILGKLYKGGSILVDQADVGDHHWETTHMKLNLTGVALMFKSLSFQTTEDGSHFEPVPADIGYQQAVRMLESSPVPASASTVPTVPSQ